MSNSSLQRVRAFVEQLAQNQITSKDYDDIKEDISQLTPMECFKIMDDIRLSGQTHEEILRYLDKVLLTFYPYLKSFEITPKQDSFIEHLHLENQGFIKHLEEIKEILKKQAFEEHKESLEQLFIACEKFDSHYLKKENILFPMLEKKQEAFKGLTLMWTLHDQTRLTLKNIIQAFKEGSSFEKMSPLIGTYFFQAYGLIQKETYILFPSTTMLSVNESESMREQSFDYGFVFIDPPQYYKAALPESFSQSKVYTSKTGVLTYEQLNMFLDLLPLDCTIVDEHDKVIYFNNPKERFFPRSEAILGRDVVHCHPQHSVQIVMDILEAFKANKQDNATFWINFKGKKLYIQYLAMRDEEGVYKGVVELTQDVSHFYQLDGERRLLDWSK